MEKDNRELKKLQESPESRASQCDESPATRASCPKRQRQIDTERRRIESPTSPAIRLEKQCLGYAKSILKKKSRHDETPISPDNIAEASNNYSNNDTKGSKLEHKTILTDKEDHSNSTRFGAKTRRVSKNTKVSSTDLISDVVHTDWMYTLDLNLNPSEPLGKYQCFLCPLNFAYKNHLSKHLLKHLLPGRRHMCQVCEKCFTEIYHLKQHLNIFTDVRRYKCEQCDDAFTTMINLSKHRKRAHSGLTSYKCNKCNYKTFERSLLNSHLNDHMDEPSFKFNSSYGTKTYEYKHKHGKRVRGDMLPSPCGDTDVAGSSQKNIFGIV